MGYLNPLLKLPAGRALLQLPPEQRAPLEALMRDLRSDADKLAEQSWRKRKGPMAAYWRAVSTYARHTAHALSKGKPENRARYPSNWAEIVAQVRERSENACEGSPDFPECRRPNGWLLNKRTGELTDDGQAAEAWELADGDKVVKIVLTTAHLDHQPENCDLSNLRHWCQRCHLHYDRHHHQANSQHTRRSRLAVSDLFIGAQP